MTFGSVSVIADERLDLSRSMTPFVKCSEGGLHVGVVRKR